MAKQQGNIGITTENIFPVIKKFLYSDHEIFLRELVSNAVDATQKLKTLSGKGEFKGELGDLKVTVSVDKDPLVVSLRYISDSSSTKIRLFVTCVLFCVAVVALLYWYFGTEQGHAIRATGCNRVSIPISILSLP